MKRIKTMVLLSAVSYLVFHFMMGGKDVHARNNLVGEPAPPMSVETWLTPTPDPAGRMVLVDFWATWCPPCRAAIPKMNEFARRFSDRLLVVGLSDEEPEKVLAMQSPVIEYSLAIDRMGRMKDAVGVTSIPHVLLVDPDGVVRWQGFPFERGHELTAEVIEELLDEYVD
jgi:thiol-disulfide isomerase/thioredoxin